MKKVLAFLFLLQTLISIAQKVNPKIQMEVMGEGTGLYNLQLANWTSTDAFYDNEMEKERVRGYVSYKDKDTVKTIFYTEIDTTRIDPSAPDTSSAEEKVKRRIKQIFFTCKYKGTVSKNSLKVNAIERYPTTYETMLIKTKIKVGDIIKNDSSFFRQYGETKLSALLLDVGKKMKAYIITTTNIQGVIPLGNDYLIVIDQKTGEVESKIKLHENFIPISTQYIKKKGDKIKSSYHNHKEGSSDYITATDYCTLLLHKKEVNWDEHHVYTPKFTCIFTPQDSKLQIIPNKEYKKITGKKIIDENEENMKPREEKEPEKKKEK